MISAGRLNCFGEADDKKVSAFGGASARPWREKRPSPAQEVWDVEIDLAMIEPAAATGRVADAAIAGSGEAAVGVTASFGMISPDMRQ
jgi:hypothetical protein